MIDDRVRQPLFGRARHRLAQAIDDLKARSRERHDFGEVGSFAGHNRFIDDGMGAKGTALRDAGGAYIRKEKSCDNTREVPNH
jgi:hypothetical protein